MSQPVRVTPVTAELRHAVLDVAVHPAQLPFVGRTVDSMADAAVCPGSEALALLVEDDVVGYVRIDRRAVALGDHPLVDGAVALRSFMIDARWQGKGLGRRALDGIQAYVEGRHPDKERILLMVNVRNEAAVHVYRSAGYLEHDELYHGGPIGPQYVMWRLLHPWKP
ncbi:GNAT family N-acetyltransferase [Luteibacter sp. 22Crub2.1]|uniref:GNAT family N-acetyltransferase n=1 Tax=Luteibacter sp. 22Crub2.1 TaxID=1283288 RepID=UPI0009A68354|nr:GNAT family N-acetyltransferase [Luteibacter sp. 22Crub2.1]SKC07387.1 Acetyltransferases [Luteibacter sp. 22Crub2.1]